MMRRKMLPVSAAETDASLIVRVGKARLAAKFSCQELAQEDGDDRLPLVRYECALAFPRGPSPLGPLEP